MNITFKELRDLKHQLPSGAVAQIAQDLKMDEQSVRNFFGAKKFNEKTQLVSKHLQPGPNGGIVEVDDTRILEMARRIVIGNQKITF